MQLLLVSLALWGFSAIRASWTHAAVKYEYRASAESAKQSSAEGLCQCLMQEFWWEILHRSSYAQQPLGVQTRLQAAPFPHGWTWLVTCNLLFLAVCITCTRNCTKTHAWSLLSGKIHYELLSVQHVGNRSFVLAMSWLWVLQPSTFLPDSTHLLAFLDIINMIMVDSKLFLNMREFSSCFPRQFLCGTFGDLFGSCKSNQPHDEVGDSFFGDAVWWL